MIPKKTTGTQVSASIANLVQRLPYGGDHPTQHRQGRRKALETGAEQRGSVAWN